MIKVLVNGAGGRMGSEVVRSVIQDPELEIVGAVDPGVAGKDLGEVIGTVPNGIKIEKSIQDALEKIHPDVVVDFTSPKVIYENAKYVLSHGVHLVVGTTGLTAEQRTELAEIAESHHANGLVAPNFSLGAVLLMQVSAEIAKYLPNAEIIELHHNHKYDAPSGTAKLTAEKWHRHGQQLRNLMKPRKALPAYAAVNMKGLRFIRYVFRDTLPIRKFSSAVTVRF